LKSGDDVDGHVKNVHVPNLQIVAAAQKYKVFARSPQRHPKLTPGNISSAFATMQSQIGKHGRINKPGQVTLFLPLFLGAGFV
jgi:hypothetical protein